ncbi:MAG: nucleotidyltransferase domain-containing protein, partial [Acidimicrobiales bacterium]
MDRDVTNDTASGAASSGAPAQPGGAAGPTLADPLAEALRVVALAERQGLQVRLMGGLAFHARCREWTALVERKRRDIDLATRSKDRKPLGELLASEGYTPDRRYNALYGHKQLYFLDEARQRPVDVLVDRLEMCHTFEFVERLT